MFTNNNDGSVRDRIWNALNIWIVTWGVMNAVLNTFCIHKFGRNLRSQMRLFNIYFMKQY